MVDERSVQAGQRAMPRHGWLSGAMVSRYGIHLFLVLLIVLSGIVAPSFLSASNLSNLLLQLVPLAIVVLGQSVVILVRGLDLSVASMMATSAVVATSFGTADSAIPEILVVSILIGICVGLLNGFLITKRAVSPFLATLATMIVLQGVRFAWTHGAPSGQMPGLIRTIGSATWHGLPVNLLALAAVAVPVALVVHRTVLGRQLTITGGNPETARLLGYRVDALVIGAYVVSGVLAAFGGLILGGYAALVDNWVGRGFELDSIVAAVIGGFALSGGRGNIGGALAGSAVLVLVSNIVLLVGLPVQVQIIVKGLIIVFAAAAYVKR